MLDNKFIFTLVGLVAAAIVATQVSPSPIIENWENMGGSKKVKVETECRDVNSNRPLSATQCQGNPRCGMINGRQLRPGPAAKIEYFNHSGHMNNSRSAGHMNNSRSAGRMNNSPSAGHMNNSAIPTMMRNNGGNNRKLGSGTVMNKNNIIKTPNFQANLAPRTMPGDYGINARQRPTSQGNLAVPVDPLSHADMAECGYAGCAKRQAQSVNCPDGDCLVNSDNATTLHGMMPKPSTMKVVDATGQAAEVVCYDRYIVANNNSRLRSQGDMIRGDLPIQPCSTGWFQVSANPAIDLQQGALAVMGGVNNQTAQDLASLINCTSGGADTTIGGVDMSNQFGTCLSGGMRDVITTLAV